MLYLEVTMNKVLGFGANNTMFYFISNMSAQEWATFRGGTKATAGTPLVKNDPNM